MKFFKSLLIKLNIINSKILFKLHFFDEPFHLKFSKPKNRNVLN